MLTTNQLATKLKVKPVTVRQWLRLKLITGTKYGRDWLLPDDTQKPTDRRLKTKD